MLKENILKTTTFIGAMDQNFDTANFVWKWVKLVKLLYRMSFYEKH